MGLMQLTYGYNRDNRFLLKNSSDKTTKYFFDRSSETASYTFSYLQIVRNAKYLCKSCKTGGILYDGNTCTNRCPSPFVNYTVNGRQ